jgi:hypothetical protein
LSDLLVSVADMFGGAAHLVDLRIVDNSLIGDLTVGPGA